MTTKTKTKKKKTSTKLINVAPKQNQAVSQVVKIINPIQTKKRTSKRKPKQEEMKPIQSNAIQPIYIPSPQVLQPPQIQSNVYDEAFKKAVLNLLNREIKVEDIKPKVKEEIKEVIQEVKEAKPAEIPVIIKDSPPSIQKLTPYRINQSQYNETPKRNLNIPSQEMLSVPRNLDKSPEEFQMRNRELGLTPPRNPQIQQIQESPNQFYTPPESQFDENSFAASSTPSRNEQDFNSLSPALYGVSDPNNAYITVPQSVNKKLLYQKIYKYFTEYPNELRELAPDLQHKRRLQPQIVGAESGLARVSEEELNQLYIKIREIKHKKKIQDLSS